MAASTFRFHWQLHDHGAATCTIGDAASTVTLVAGYLTDALADVLYGMQALYRDNGFDRFFFDEEPAEIRWTVRRAGPNAALSIYRFDDVSVSLDLPDSLGRLLWRSTQPRGRVTHAVIAVARRVLREHGEQGYQAKWVRHPFPMNALLDLERHHERHDGCGQQCLA